jgi:hypothetical protein
MQLPGHKQGRNSASIAGRNCAVYRRFCAGLVLPYRLIVNELQQVFMW